MMAIEDRAWLHGTHAANWQPTATSNVIHAAKEQTRKRWYRMTTLYISLVKEN